ncbi:MAG: hypothetical protein LBR28_03350 [Bacteroidales bacterium]|nr:hypothetical protein [Bacteroidales bacterium]
MFIVFVIAVILLAFYFIGLAIKIIFKKNGEFKRQCSSCDPYTGKRQGCLCGKDSINMPCDKDKHHSVLEVNKELLEELK